GHQLADVVEELVARLHGRASCSRPYMRPRPGLHKSASLLTSPPPARIKRRSTETGMIPFPDISPDIFSISVFGMTFALRWYAMAYLVGIAIAWWIAARTLRRADLWGGGAPMNRDRLDRVMTWVILGVSLGGRIGYVLFYEPAKFAADPAAILRVWEGGMSFHGGFLGVVAAGVLFARAEGIPMLRLG